MSEWVKIYLEVSDLHSQQLVLRYVQKTGFKAPFRNGARFLDIFRTNYCECGFDTSGHIFLNIAQCKFLLGEGLSKSEKQL